MKPFSSPGLCLAFLFASLLPALAADPKVGDSVAAPWNDGGFYMATITRISNGEADLVYDDGDKLAVPVGKVRVLSREAGFKVGDHVLAAWKGARMYPGVVTAVTEATCTVKWDDGDAPQDVSKARMTVLAKE